MSNPTPPGPYGPQDRPGGPPGQPGGYGQQPPGQPGGYGQPGPYGQRPQPYSPYGAQPYGYGYAAPPAGNLATWLPRVGASLLDGLITAVPIWIAYAILLAGGSDGPGVVAGLLSTVLFLVSLGLWIWNRLIKQGRTGQSIGKRLVGLRLVDAGSGQPIGAGKAFLRELCHILDGLPCYLGYLWPLWDEKRQTFADKIVNTYVVRA